MAKIKSPPLTLDSPRTPAPGTSPTVPQADLKRGSTGAQVKQMQDALVQLGYLTKAQVKPAYGSFNARTEVALKRFQQSQGLPASGRLDQATRAAMQQALAAGAAAPARAQRAQRDEFVTPRTSTLSLS